MTTTRPTVQSSPTALSSGDRQNLLNVTVGLSCTSSLLILYFADFAPQDTAPVTLAIYGYKSIDNSYQINTFARDFSSNVNKQKHRHDTTLEATQLHKMTFDRTQVAQVLDSAVVFRKSLQLLKPVSVKPSDKLKSPRRHIWIGE